MQNGNRVHITSKQIYIHVFAVLSDNIELVLRPDSDDSYFPNDTIECVLDKPRINRTVHLILLESSSDGFLNTVYEGPVNLANNFSAGIYIYRCVAYLEEEHTIEGSFELRGVCVCV